MKLRMKLGSMSKTQSSRVQMFESTISKVAQKILNDQFKKIDMCNLFSISKIKCSNDLGVLDLYLSEMPVFTGHDNCITLSEFKSNIDFEKQIMYGFKSQLARNVKMRKIPEIRFFVQKEENNLFFV